MSDKSKSNFESLKKQISGYKQQPNRFFLNYTKFMIDDPREGFLESQKKELYRIAESKFQPTPSTQTTI
jgi:hypothetical protein